MSDIDDLLMETLAMFSRLTAFALLRGSENCQLAKGARRNHVGHRSPNRCRRQFRLEGLEDRSLLSGISGVTEFGLSSPQAALSAITAGPGGDLWFTDRGGNAIGTINPATDAISLYPVPTASAWPYGIVAGPDGNLWFTEKSAIKIGMINPTTHAISEFALPSGFAAPAGITAGPDGNLWFTNSATSAIGEINPTTHAITRYTYSATLGFLAFSITAGSNGNLWFGPHNGPSGYVAEINPTTGAVTSFACPTFSMDPMSMTSGPDGNVWFTSSASNVISAINPTTGAISEFTIPTANADPCGITAGPDGNLWFVESAGKIASVNPTTDAITEYPVGYGGYGITTGPDGNLWFTDPGTNAIGVATLTASQLVVTTQPPSTVTAGSGFGLAVTAEDSSGNPITSFNGTVTVALANNPGGATLGGTLTATATNGVATFSGLTLTKAASGYTLVLSGSGIGAGVTSAFTVTPAAATQLVIATQPPATVKLSTAFGMEALIEDQYGNVVTTANNTVTVALGNNPSKATLGGTLTVTANQGVVTFSNLTINEIGSGYTLVVASTGLGPAVTDPFNVTKKGT
jgi:streptogramin lyase